MRYATLLSFIFFALVACQSNQGRSDQNTMDMQTTEAKQPLHEKDPATPQQADRKIIRQGEIRFETSSMTETNKMLVRTVKGLGGYIVSENAYEYEGQRENSMVIRVPASKFDSLLETISRNVPTLEHKSINTVDVSEEYVDIEARIKTKKELQNRYRELLKQATKVDEMVTIEKEMGTLQAEIESIEGRMQYLKDQVLYSTLTVNYYKKTSRSFAFGKNLGEALGRGWNNFLWFVVGLANLWVFWVIAAVLIVFLRRRRKRKNQKT